MYRSIMVPLDGSVFSEHALPLALAIARRAGATLELAQAYNATSSLYDASGLPSLDNGMEAEARKREQAYLTGMAQRLAATWDLTVNATLLDEAGSIAEVVRQHALRSAVDLVVMTTHGRGGLARLWLGSVADALVRRAPMPILLVRPHTEALDLLDLRREQLVRQILIPLDGSVLAEDILEPAVALATIMHAECTLLQSISPILAEDALDALVIAKGGQQLAHSRAEACAYLEGVAERLRAQGVPVRTSVVVGPATEAILAYSRQHLIDLIAMATHGRGGIARMLVGSVAEQVVRCACAPVLLHRPCGAARQDEATSGVAHVDHGSQVEST